MNMLRGVAIGVANIIPGVSGGTIAVVLGIYHRLIGAISNIRKQFKSSILFLIPILIGAGIGILAFNSLLQEVLFKHFPMQTNLLFLGLVLGSIPMIVRNSGIKKASAGSIVPFIIALVGMVCITVFLKGDKSANPEFVLSVGTALMLMLSGMVAAIAMLLPGISGSLMLVVMGYYNVITGALSLSNLNLPVLLLFGVGVLAGLLCAAKLIDICLRKFQVPTYAAIIGLVVGSLYQVFVEANFEFNIQGVFAVVALIVGTLIALAFGNEKLSARFSTKKQEKKQ